MANKKDYLPENVGWFRLTDYVKKIVKAGSIEDIFQEDATDGVEAANLANANKAKINELLAVLRTATILDEDAGVAPSGGGDLPPLGQ